MRNRVVHISLINGADAYSLYLHLIWFPFQYKYREKIRQIVKFFQCEKFWDVGEKIIYQFSETSIWKINFSSASENSFKIFP
jgi:hypothetical protein